MRKQPTAPPKGGAVLFPELDEANFVCPDPLVPADFTAPGEADSPSLSKGHNCDRPEIVEEESGQKPLPFRLSGSQAKTAFALRHNAEGMIAEAGLGCAAFLTLTVGDESPEGFRQVWDAAEASRRIHNLNRRVMKFLFRKSIVVTERHKSGAIHFHIVGVLRSGVDIRTGFDFSAVKKGDYSSACPELKKLWEMLRETLPNYGFGRAELTPIEKTGEAVAMYVSKYIEKNLFNRLPEDKGKKLVRYLGFEKRHLKPNEFSWATPRAAKWRLNAESLAALAGVRDRSEVAECFGPRWAYRLSRVMNAVAGSDREACVEIGGSYPIREVTRQLVLREARRRWVMRRQTANVRVPGNGWHWRPLRERLQKTFEADGIEKQTDRNRRERITKWKEN
jgi:hypothetical protein